MTDPRPLLDSSHRTDEVSRQIAEFHADYVEEVRRAVAEHALVVVGMAQNPVVKEARRALEKAQIPYHYVGHGNYLSGYRRRLAVKMWSGYPTFPQVFVQGVLIGGNRELQAALADGSLRTRLDGPRPDGRA